MKRALLVCYYFPPLGGAGIGRPLALFNHLEKHGYLCDVLTVKNVLYRMYEPDIFAGLDAARIHRSGSYDPQRMMYCLGVRKIRGTTIDRTRGMTHRFFPDPKVGWVRPAIRRGRTLLGARDYAAVISTSPPISCHLIAKQLAADFSLPWLADFRDYWASHRLEDWYHDPSQIRRARNLLDEIRDTASHISAVNQSVADYVKADSVVSNSFDTEMAKRWQPPSPDAPFTIGLLGTYGPEMRPVRPLLDALARLREDHPDLVETAEVLQVGDVDRDWLVSELERFDLLRQCRMLGYQPRKAAIRILSATSLFYIGLIGSRDSGHTTARIFDMIASGRPILAAVPSECEISGLIGQTGNGLVFDSDSVGAGVDYLRLLMADHRNGILKIQPNPDYARPFTAESMVARFADLLDSLTG